MSNHKKKLWSEWEKIALKHYLEKGYILLKKNYNKRWGEIDLVLLKDNTTIFVEVKVVDHIQNLHNYVTKKKLKNLQKTIEAYLRKHNVETDLRLDVVFVRNGSILEVIENVALMEEVG